MGDVIEFDFATKRRDPIPFKLPGEDYLYKFNPPKQAYLALQLINGDFDNDTPWSSVYMDWLKQGLPKTDMDRIHKRLRNEKDQLDMDDMEKYVNGLLERISGDRPTT